IVHQLRLITGHQLAEATRADVAGPVADVDVKTLRAADAVDDRHSEGRIPAGVKIAGQSLARAPHEAKAGDIAALLLRRLQHFVDERGYAGEHRGAVFRDFLEQQFRRGRFAYHYGGGAHRERKHQVRAGGITEEQPRAGDGDVGFADADKI